MRCGTSCFDLTLYRKSLTRFWPLWAANLVFWLIVLPMRGVTHQGQSLIRFAAELGELANSLNLVFAVGISALVAMAMCSHLYAARSANFMAALPVRREGQFISTYLAGLTMLVAPNVLVFLLTLLVETLGGGLVVGSLLFWLGTLCGMELFFYSFAMFIGQFTGHILALPVYYGVFNALAITLYSIVEWLMGEFCYGFAGNDTFRNAVIEPLTPAWMMAEHLRYENWWGPNLNYDVPERVTVEGLPMLGAYALVGVVLAVCALLLYRCRKMESAGDVVAVPVMRPVFKYGVAFCAGLTLGMVTREILSLNVAGLCVAVVFWAVVGYFAAQMLLDKSFKVFRKWKGAVAMAGVIVLLFAVLILDLTGFETRIPAVENVASVRIGGLPVYPYDSGSDFDALELTEEQYIRLATEIHRGAVEDRGKKDRYWDADWGANVRITYTLKNGGKMQRRYYIYGSGSSAEAAEALVSDPELARRAYHFEGVRALEAEGYTLRTAGVLGWDLTSHAGALWESVLEAYEKGEIGAHSLAGDGADFGISFEWRNQNGMRWSRDICIPNGSPIWRQAYEALLAEYPEHSADYEHVFLKELDLGEDLTAAGE
ncbi:MAG: hypothetical protein PUB51_05605 [Oscillospiraceae bacterium]|nr:hypothetical protein [Oscillospiraceae bacterium]